MNGRDGSRRHMVRWENCVRLEGVYLMRKYSHCPILKKCKFFEPTFLAFYYRIEKRSTFWHLVHFGSKVKQCVFDGYARKWRHGRLCWWYFFQRWSIDIWTQIRRSFEFNINCTPFMITISMCVPIGVVFLYSPDSMINRLTKALLSKVKHIKHISKTHRFSRLDFRRKERNASYPNDCYG